MRIAHFRATAVACHDQPLRNCAGVHATHFIRTIVQLFTDEGLTGLGETSGDVVAEMEANRHLLVGADPRNTTKLRLEFKGSPSAFCGIETACLDAAAKRVGLPLCDYIGGRVRDEVPFSAYLFFKFADEGERARFALANSSRRRRWWRKPESSLKDTVSRR